MCVPDGFSSCIIFVDEKTSIYFETGHLPLYINFTVKISGAQIHSQNNVNSNFSLLKNDHIFN